MSRIDGWRTIAAALPQVSGPARTAFRAAVTESRRSRAQREQLARLEELCEAPVTTLPYLFSAELGAEAVEALADRVVAA